MILRGIVTRTHDSYGLILGVCVCVCVIFNARRSLNIFTRIEPQPVAAMCSCLRLFISLCGVYLTPTSDTRSRVVGGHTGWWAQPACLPVPWNFSGRAKG